MSLKDIQKRISKIPPRTRFIIIIIVASIVIVFFAVQFRLDKVILPREPGGEPVKVEEEPDADDFGADVPGFEFGVVLLSVPIIIIIKRKNKEKY